MSDESRFRFERLDVWHRGIAFASEIYCATRTFPVEDRYGLTSQLRRASVSISSNIAEGSSRSSDADFARFIEIAYGSLMECVSQCYIAKEHGFLASEAFARLYGNADELGRMLSSFRARLKP
jgi:four helix bundle protein